MFQTRPEQSKKLIQMQARQTIPSKKIVFELQESIYQNSDDHLMLSDFIINQYILMDEMIAHLETGKPIINYIEDPIELLEILENKTFTDEIKELSLQQLKRVISKLIKIYPMTQLQVQVENIIENRIKNNSQQNYRYYELVAILYCKSWDQIFPNIESVITNSNHFREISSALFALLKIFQVHEYQMDDNPYLFNIIADGFLPLLADLMFKLLSNYSELTSKLVSKILKIYLCIVNTTVESSAKESFPQWNQYFCLIINKGNQKNVKWTTRIFSRMHMNFDIIQIIIDCVPLIIESCYDYLLNQNNICIQDNTASLKNIFLLFSSLLEYYNTQAIMLNYITLELMAVVIYSIQFDMDLRVEDPKEYLTTANETTNDLNQLRCNGSNFIQNVIALSPQYMESFINEIKYSIVTKQYSREAALLRVFSEFNKNLHQVEIEQVLNIIITEFNSPQAIIREITCYIFGQYPEVENFIIDQGCQKLMECLTDTDLVVRSTAAIALGSLTTIESCRGLIYEQIILVSNEFIKLITETELEQVIYSFLKISEIGITPYTAKLIQFTGDLFLKKISEINSFDDEDNEASLICNHYLDSITQLINLDLSNDDYDSLSDIIKNIIDECLTEGTGFYEAGLRILRSVIQRSQDLTFLKYFEILTYQIMGLHEHQIIPSENIWQACKSQLGLHHYDMVMIVLRTIVKRGDDQFLIQRDIFEVTYIDLLFNLWNFTVDQYSINIHELSQVLKLFITFVKVYKRKIDNQIPMIVQTLIPLINSEIDQQEFHLFALVLAQWPKPIMDYLHFMNRTDILSKYMAFKLPKNNKQVLSDLLYALCKCLSLPEIPQFFLENKQDVCKFMMTLKQLILKQQNQLTNQSISETPNREDEEVSIQEIYLENHSSDVEELTSDSVDSLDELIITLQKASKKDPQQKIKKLFADKLNFYNSKIQQ